MDRIIASLRFGDRPWSVRAYLLFAVLTPVAALAGKGVPPVEADAGQLRTALSDLIVNALEAMAEGGGTRLALAVQLREPDVWISVTDDGPGVAPELREKIFYPFFTTKERGAGVGLASAQKVVASHGGHIELDARRGRGCAFHVRLPANARRGAMSARGAEQ